MICIVLDQTEYNDYENSCCFGESSWAALFCNGARRFTSRGNHKYLDEFDKRPYSLNILIFAILGPVAAGLCLPSPTLRPLLKTAMCPLGRLYHKVGWLGPRGPQSSYILGWLGGPGGRGNPPFPLTIYLFSYTQQGALDWWKFVSIAK